MKKVSSLLLVHGAGSGPWVFDGWSHSFTDRSVHCVDLHAGLDVASASMDDYVEIVLRSSQTLPRPVVLCGWSMGGLVVLQAAVRAEIFAVVVIEPSPPAEIQGLDSSVTPHDGTFDPEETYGPFPAGMPARAESTRARMERQRGISVPNLPCRSFVVYGDEFPEDRGRLVARLYGSEELSFPGLGHWDLVRDPCVPETIGAALDRS